MISAGIDLGNQTIKVAIMGDGQLLAHSTVFAGADAKSASQRALDEALETAKLKPGHIERILATGAGRSDAPFAHEAVTEVTCNAKGAIWLFPSTRMVIDLGAEEGRAIKCDATGRVLAFTKNDKCAAGAGVFVEAMAKALEVKLEDMGELSLRSHKEIPVNVTCAVFAESEVISLIHSGVDKVDIVRAINDAIASRTASMARRIGIEMDITLIGGVARNIGFVHSLKRDLGIELLVPDNPQIVSALGAALLAQDTIRDGAQK